MNPLLAEAIGSIFRWLFALGAGWLVSHGVWTQANATIYVSAAALGAVSLLWSLIEKYRSRLTLVTALTMPVGASEHDVQIKIDAGVRLPSVSTPKNVAPAPTA